MGGRGLSVRCGWRVTSRFERTSKFWTMLMDNRGATGKVPVAVVVVLSLLLSTVDVRAQQSSEEDSSRVFGDVTGVHRPAVEILWRIGWLADTDCWPPDDFGDTGDNADWWFCPDRPIPRWMMAVWLVRALEGAPARLDAPGRFVDVPADVWWAAYPERLAELGVTKGCSRDKYCPDQPVTRAQMATFLHRALPDLPEATTSVGPFTDTADDLHRDGINFLASRGVTAGCGDGTTFCPDSPVTKGQMATFLARALDLVHKPITGPPPPYRITYSLFSASTVAPFSRGGAIYNCGQNYYLSAINTDGTGQQLLAQDAVQFETSPDGQHLVYKTEDKTEKRWRDQWWLVNADGTGNRLFEDRLYIGDWDFVWSPDGNRVAYLAGSHHKELWILDVDGTGHRKYTDLVVRAEEVRWSPDGAKLAYRVTIPDGEIYRNDDFGNETGEMQWWVMDADGTNLWKLPRDTDSFQWSPNSDSIAYLAINPEDRFAYEAELWVVDADGTNLRELTHATPRFRWSPDGARIAFDGEDRGLWVVNADGTRPRRVADQTWRWLWSPDSRSISYSHSHGVPGWELWVVDADGTNQRKLSDDISWGYGGFEEWMQWSPDGNYMAFRVETSSRRRGGEGYGQELWVVDVDGINPRKLSDNTRRGVSWSPDGTRLVYSVEEDPTDHAEWLETDTAFSKTELWIENADGTNPRQISLRSNFDVYKYGDDAGWDDSGWWSPDGALFVYRTDIETTRGYSGYAHLWAVDLNGTRQLIFSTHSRAPSNRDALKIDLTISSR